jgi:hypothetical protein
MRIRFLGALLALSLVVCAIRAIGQEYRINKPGDPSPAPVYLTLPVEGSVEVTNLPPVQEVRITGGTLDGPVEVQGDLGFRIPEPLLVEVTNPPEIPRKVEIDGAVRVDDTQPLQVWVENFPEPKEPASRQFAAYAFSASFGAEESKTQRAFLPPKGSIFHLTDLVIDTRPDAVLKVRVTAPASAIAGSVAAATQLGLPLAVLDTRFAPSVRLGTPAPLLGEFSVVVEALLGPGQGAPFQLLASGYLLPARK